MKIFDLEKPINSNEKEIEEIGKNQKYIFYSQKEIEEEEELLGMINLKNEKEIKSLDITGK